MGSTYDRRTKGCAAKWNTTSGSTCLNVSLTLCESRTSPMRESIPWDTLASTNKLGSVGGGRLKPTTRDPRCANRRDSHEPMKPVWPVTITDRPRQKSTFTTVSKELSRCARALLDGSCLEACPWVARTRGGNRPTTVHHAQVVLAVRAPIGWHLHQRNR